MPARPFQINATDPTLFPFRHWARLLNRAWRNPRAELVTKIDPFGWPDLRAAIARHLGEWRGMVCHGEQIIITSGAADAMQLIARSSFAPGDSVYLEEPGFPTLLQGVRRAGLVACPVLVDADGFDPDRAFARRAARDRNAITPIPAWRDAAATPPLAAARVGDLSRDVCHRGRFRQ